MKLFALIDNGQVVVGPRSYYPNAFSRYLSETNQSTDFIFPREFDGQSLEVSDTVKLLEVNQTTPSYDSLTEQLAGPFLTVGETSVDSTFTVVPRDVSAVRNDIKALIAARRYEKEVATVEVDIDGLIVKPDTGRGERDIYAQAMLLMSDTDTYKFKFPKSGNWAVLTKAQLALIVQAIMSQVQGAFTWEGEQNELLDAAETIEDLISVKNSALE
jgi:hypothetical protein